MIKLRLKPPEMSLEEAAEYIRIVNERYPNVNGWADILEPLDCDDEVEVRIEPEAVPFQRIRRITGYLTGTVDRWNNAKKSELADRVKHGAKGGNNGEAH